jgi:hypothetical protein
MCKLVVGWGYSLMGKESLCAEGFEEGWLGAIYGKRGKRGVAINLTTKI